MSTLPILMPLQHGWPAVLLALAAADDGYAANLLGEADAVVRITVGRAHHLVLERQVSKRVLDHEANQPVAVKDEIAAVARVVADDGVHAPIWKFSGSTMRFG